MPSPFVWRVRRLPHSGNWGHAGTHSRVTTLEGLDPAKVKKGSSRTYGVGTAAITVFVLCSSRPLWVYVVIFQSVRESNTLTTRWSSPAFFCRFDPLKTLMGPHDLTLPASHRREGVILAYVVRKPDRMNISSVRSRLVAQHGHRVQLYARQSGCLDRPHRHVIMAHEHMCNGARAKFSSTR
jgi:hypothetical protein